MEGLEPTHLAALDPKSSVSTNFTTSAFTFVQANPKKGIAKISKISLNKLGDVYYFQEPCLDGFKFKYYL